MSTKTQVAALAAKGMPAADIARELGVTESYISQLGNDDDYARIYAGLVAHEKVATHSKHAQIDMHYDSLELKLLDHMDTNSDIYLAAFIDKPGTLLGLMKTLNGAKRRAVGEGKPVDEVADMVPIVLPTFITNVVLPTVEHNEQNEVIAVDDRALVSLGNKALRTQLADHVEKETLELEHQATQLVPTILEKTEPITAENFEGM